MWPDHIVQGAILILSAASIGLVSCRGRWVLWGWMLGLISQPFWLYASASASQWGIFLLSVFYTVADVNGILNHWND